MTKERERYESIDRARRCGLSHDDAVAVRRIALTLHRWFELECGDGNGCIERDRDTDICYWLSGRTGARFRIPDRETGARKRLDKILARYPDRFWKAYIQTDPRGGTIYLCKPEDATDSLYTRGVLVA